MLRPSERINLSNSIILQQKIFLAPRSIEPNDSRRLEGAARARAPIIQIHLWFHQLLPPFAPPQYFSCPLIFLTSLRQLSPFPHTCFPRIVEPYVHRLRVHNPDIIFNQETVKRWTIIVQENDIMALLTLKKRSRFYGMRLLHWTSRHYSKRFVTWFIPSAVVLAIGTSRQRSLLITR